MIHAPVTAEEIIGDPFFPRLKAFIVEATGLHYYTSQDLELGRFLAARFTELQLPNCGGYWCCLHDETVGPVELDVLIGQLTIGETFFFRHAEQFQALCDIAIPELLRRNAKSKQLRIWSAGCATGAEPYSIAILLKQRWPELFADWNVTILGTDINRAFLAQAEEGTFNDWALRATPLELAKACFSQSESRWQINPEFRRCVTFHRHNLVQDSFPPPCDGALPFDLIFCRNVMIYFSPEVTQQIIDRFFDCLALEAWLVVGHAESNTLLFEKFETVNSGDTALYRKPSVKKFPPASNSNVLLPAAGAGKGATTAAKSFLPAKGITEPRPIVGQLLDETRREPLNPAAHFEYAMVLFRRGRHSEAERALRRTLYLDRNFVLAHYYLALLLKRRGQTSAARRSLRNARRLLEPARSSHTTDTCSAFSASALLELTQKHFEELAVR
jgi:chemotaxis protein methyltransferase CheR